MFQLRAFGYSITGLKFPTGKKIREKISLSLPRTQSWKISLEILTQLKSSPCKCGLFMCENNDEFFFVCSASHFTKASLMGTLISFVVCYLYIAGNLPLPALTTRSISFTRARRYKKNIISRFSGTISGFYRKQSNIYLPAFLVGFLWIFFSSFLLIDTTAKFPNLLFSVTERTWGNINIYGLINNW